MKLLINGVFLLALTLTITDALDKKRECDNPTDEVKHCLGAAANLDDEILCSSACKSTLTKYYNKCFKSDIFERFRLEYHQRCGAAATMVTLFTVISAVLIAAIN